jgi:hypothetical protein
MRNQLQIALTLFLISMSVGCEIQMTESTIIGLNTHKIVQLHDGTFMFLWNNQETGSSEMDMRIQRYDSALNKIGDQIIYNPNPLIGGLGYIERIESVSVLTDHTVAIAYITITNSSQNSELYFTIIDYNGTIIKNHERVNDDDYDLMTPSILLFNDDIIITWISWINEEDVIKYKVYSIDGEIKLTDQIVFIDPKARINGIIQLDNDKFAIFFGVITSVYNMTHYVSIYSKTYNKIVDTMYLFSSVYNIIGGLIIGKTDEYIMISWIGYDGNIRPMMYQYYDLNLNPISDVYTVENLDYSFFVLSSNRGYIRQAMILYDGKQSINAKIFKIDENHTEQRLSCYYDNTMNFPKILPIETNKYIISWRTKISGTYPEIYRFKILVCSDELTLDINKLSINDGQTVQLSTKNIYALNGCNKTNVNYTITNQEHIIFKLNDTIVSTFTSEDIDNGFVWVYHDGSGISPNYEVSVSYENTTTESMNAIITFNGEEIIVETSSSQIESDSTTQTSSETSSNTQTSSEQMSSEQMSSEKTNSENEKSESSENEKSFSSDTISSEETHENSDTKTYSSNEDKISSDSQSSSNTKKLLPWEISLIVLGSATVVGGSIAGGTFYVKKRQKKIGNNVEMT